MVPSSPSQTQTGPAQGYYQCTDCKKTYTRVDHLARHVRSHMQEKPFECDVCKKRFGRPDLLKRHALNHEGQDADAKRQKRLRSQSSRVSQACKTCATSKLKCEEQKPCKRCLSKNLICEYGADSKPRNDAEDLQDVRTASTPAPIDEGLIPSSLLQSAPQILPTTNLMNQDQFATTDDTFLSDFLKDVLMSDSTTTFDLSAQPQWQDNMFPASHDILDYTAGTFDFSPEDYGFMDGMADPNVATSFEISKEAVHPSDLKKRAGLAAEAYKTWSFSRWSPTEHDHAFAEQFNLSLQDGDTLDAKRQQLPRISESLKHTTRDRIFNLALDSCKYSKTAPPITAFPATSLCDDLVQSFLYNHRKLLDDWVHIPSVRPNEQLPELTCCMIAVAAISTGVKSLQKLGFALQEVARLTLPIKCEENNSATRELGLVQAFMLELEIGAWSGSRRKIEIAESHAHVHITMLRRGGQFYRSKRLPIVPLPEDEGRVLEEKWEQWAERESFKRLALHAFVYDTQCSISLLRPPTTSYGEMTVGLPVSQDLWTAPTAQRWKDIFLNSGTVATTLPSTVDCVLDPSILTSSQASCHLDASGIVVLHAYWGMIFDYTQMSSLQKRKRDVSRESFGPILGSRYQDLVKSLTFFRMTLSEWHIAPRPEVEIILEVLFLYLHLSLDDIQLFAGKEDKEEARRVLPSLFDWVNSTTARQAMFHAGQILRAARKMLPQQIKDFYAIAVYHASLAFWVYGILQQNKNTQNERALFYSGYHGNNQTSIILDGMMTTEVERFITLGRGTPVITKFTNGNGASQHVPLEEPDNVMKLFLDTVSRNARPEPPQEVPHPLVTNLMQLMRDLGNVAQLIYR